MLGVYRLHTGERGRVCKWRCRFACEVCEQTPPPGTHEKGECLFRGCPRPLPHRGRGLSFVAARCVDNLPPPLRSGGGLGRGYENSRSDGISQYELALQRLWSCEVCLSLPSPQPLSLWDKHCSRSDKYCLCHTREGVGMRASIH